MAIVCLFVFNAMFVWGTEHATIWNKMQLKPSMSRSIVSILFPSLSIYDYSIHMWLIQVARYDKTLHEWALVLCPFAIHPCRPPIPGQAPTSAYRWIFIFTGFMISHLDCDNYLNYDLRSDHLVKSFLKFSLGKHGYSDVPVYYTRCCIYGFRKRNRVEFTIATDYIQRPITTCNNTTSIIWNLAIVIQHTHHFFCCMCTHMSV